MVELQLERFSAAVSDLCARVMRPSGPFLEQKFNIAVKWLTIYKLMTLNRVFDLCDVIII